MIPTPNTKMTPGTVAAVTEGQMKTSCAASDTIVSTTADTFSPSPVGAGLQAVGGGAA